MVKLYHYLVYSHLTYALLAWGRSGLTNAAKIECAHRRACKLLRDYNYRILTFHSIYDYFALLKAFNTNTLNFHQYFKDKLSSHQPSHMHNTRHRINSNFNTLLLITQKTQKCYLYQVIPIWNSLLSSFKFFLNYIGIYFSLSSSPNYILEFFLARLAMLPCGLNSILPNYLQTCLLSHFHFYYCADYIVILFQ